MYDKDILWAPWRGCYVTEKKSEDCIFCDKPAQNDDAVNYIVHRSGLAYIIMNLYPYNNGHLMVIPFRHTPDYTDLNADELADIAKLTQLSLTAVKNIMNPGGFNIGWNVGAVAGAGIAGHLHQHIVPRWGGDSNFMPVIAETKVICEHMDVTYEKLKNEIRRLI